MGCWGTSHTCRDDYYVELMANLGTMEKALHLNMGTDSVEQGPFTQAKIIDIAWTVPPNLI